MFDRLLDGLRRVIIERLGGLIWLGGKGRQGPFIESQSVRHIVSNARRKNIRNQRVIASKRAQVYTAI